VTRTADRWTVLYEAPNGTTQWETFDTWEAADQYANLVGIRNAVILVAAAGPGGGK